MINLLIKVITVKITIKVSILDKLHLFLFIINRQKTIKMHKIVQKNLRNDSILE